MSQVRVKDRTESCLNVFLKARELVAHTDLILANPKVFHCSSVIDEKRVMSISDCALAIYTNAWTANDVRVTSKKSYLRRNELQHLALAKCNELLAMIDLSKKKFHLRNNKYLYWKDLAIEVKKLINGWKSSDNKRYSEYRK